MPCRPRHPQPNQNSPYLFDVKDLIKFFALYYLANAVVAGALIAVLCLAD
jgi:hypothetical protein